MNKLRFLSFLFAAFFLITLSSCDKDDDEEVAPNKSALLTAHAWQGNTVYLNGIKAPDDAIRLEIKTIKLNFTNDRTFTATYRDSGVPQTVEGLWDLQDNTMKMNFPFLNDPGEYSEVTRLTANNFDVSVVYTTQNGAKQAIELRFVPAK